MPPDDAWSLASPWHCSHCGDSFGIRPNGGTFPIPRSFKPMAPLLTEDVARRFTFYSKPNFYVYALCYPTGLPFYIGVGYGYRCFAHATETINRSNRWGEKHDVILPMLQSSEGLWYHFLALQPGRDVAAKIEAYWISKLGFRSKGGMLTNSVKPANDLDEYSDQPPEIPEDVGGHRSNIIKSFQHPDMVLAPPVGSATRSGKLFNCWACGVQGQMLGAMRFVKILCSNCGHYLIPWEHKVDDGSQRIFFGDDVVVPLNS